MLIVYPDADPEARDWLMDHPLANELRKLAEFRIYVGRPESHKEYVKRVKDADGILLGWGIPNEVITECPNLKVISFTGIGASNFVDLKYAESRGIIVTNTPGYADNTVAEHALALLLSLTKNIVPNHQRLAKGVWDQSRNSVELRGKTIGLIGLGGIGKRMAELCKAIGMNVICWTFNPTPDRAQQLGITFTGLEELLQESDVVSLHLPYTEQTAHMLSYKELSLMKNEAILINTSRAQLIDTDAMVKCLLTGRISGAGIDVFDEEPIIKDHPLLSLPNVVLSPHIGYKTPEASMEIMNISISNLIQFFQGKIQNAIN
ncbi:2-hydroxyacid dehydrogenase [Bacillus rubiinfantis]|uniref:2-hydroxyacid dehydrogenase n=1 Tax=Bacillus rubiinfantis TaxID=1499680 RepID=UPI0009E3AD48|nr:D-isomer specific 2-hydroxyacid dehydrogenase family protein [Bacillus rubiinfantis]